MLGWNVIYAEGEITADSPAQLKAFLHDNASPTRTITQIILNSPGGDIDAGFALGELIRTAGLDTVVGKPVPGRSRITVGGGDLGGVVIPVTDLGVHVVGAGAECDSACTLVFIGGVTRTVSNGARFGVHRWWTPKHPLDEQETQASEGQLASYIAKMGVSDEMFTLSTTAPPGGMLYLDDQTLERLNITTHEVATARVVQGTRQPVLEMSDEEGAEPAQRIEFYCSNRQLRAQISALNRFKAIQDLPASDIHQTIYHWAFYGASELLGGSVDVSASDAETQVVAGPLFTINFAVPYKVSKNLSHVFTLDLWFPPNISIGSSIGFNRLDSDSRATVQSFVDACSAN